MLTSALWMTLWVQPANIPASGITTIAVSLLAFSTLMAAAGRDQSRYQWAGYAIFSGFYLLFTIGPGFARLDSPILSNRIFLEIYLNVAGVTDSRFLSDPEVITSHKFAILPYLQICHSAAAMVVGTFGAMLAYLIRKSGDQAR
ncbi:hypothetical protein P12x_004857 [Tundrisphaera lichenicola]|uniref:hypothetical protein n=1 Tax=Tundrisphaera lichenicola TaxID=2029860 RepID=UPI003EBE13AF